jgi:hypothetical protein
VVEVRVLLGTSWLPVLKVVLRMLQMVCTRRVAPSNRAFLEVTLQDITSAKRVLAQVAGIGTLARICVVLVSG